MCGFVKIAPKIISECIKENLEGLTEKKGLVFTLVPPVPTTHPLIIVQQRAEFRLARHLFLIYLKKVFDSVNRECICNAVCILMKLIVIERATYDGPKCGVVL